MSFYVYLIAIVLLVGGCQSREKAYKISKEGVFSNHTIITQFSISQFPMDHLNTDDIRPHSHVETMRYCCELKKNQHGKTKIIFATNDSNYRWNLCKLDMSLIENDSLNNLSFEAKLQYLKERNRHRTYVPSDHFRLPFQVDKGYVYQIFGLPNLEGSYYFRLDSDDKLLVQFVDMGPW